MMTEIRDLRIGELLELVNTVQGLSGAGNNCPYIGKYVVVRTYAAGVHVGVLKSYDYKTRHATLTESRRIWSWEGAFTLSELSVNGITGGRIALELPEIMITQVEEIIPASALSEKILRSKGAFKP